MRFLVLNSHNLRVRFGQERQEKQRDKSRHCLCHNLLGQSATSICLTSRTREPTWARSCRQAGGHSSQRTTHVVPPLSSDRIPSPHYKNVFVFLIPFAEDHKLGHKFLPSSLLVSPYGVNAPFYFACGLEFAFAISL